LATTVGAVESGARWSVARFHGVVGLRVSAIGGDVTSKDVSRPKALNGSSVVGSSRGAAVPRGERPALNEVVEGEDGLENRQFTVLAFEANEPEESLASGIGRGTGNLVVAGEGAKLDIVEKPSVIEPSVQRNVGERRIGVSPTSLAMEGLKVRTTVSGVDVFRGKSLFAAEVG